MSYVWEQRKLGEICETFEYGLNVAAKEYDGEHKYLRITDIDDSSHAFLQDNLTSPNVDFANSENYKLKYGDVLFARTGASVGKTYIYEDFDGLVYYAGFLIRGRVKSDYSPKFIFQNTLTDEYDRFIRITSQRSGQPGINALEYSRYQILVPTLAEQARIGEYFSNLDRLITLHQRKILLYKYFLTIVWEQRKLGELASIYDGVHKTPNYKDSGIMFLSVENIITLKSKKYISEEDFERDYKVHPERGDIFMTRIGDVGTTNVVESSEKLAFYVSLALLKPIDSYPYFLSNAMKTNDFQMKLRKRTLVTAIPQKINKDEIGKLELFITYNFVEQKKIGDYFRKLDQLITLHRCKCIFYRKNVVNAWEQRKLGEITESYSGGTPTAGKKEYYDGDIPFIRSGEINSEKTELFITDEALNNSSAKMVKKGDILYALYGATSGEVSISKLKGAINQAILAIQPYQNYNSQFLMQWLRKSKESIIGTYLQGGQGNLSGNIVKELIIDVPTYEEQKEIGTYLKDIDHLITLHQWKYIVCTKIKVNTWIQCKFIKIGVKLQKCILLSIILLFKRRKVSCVFYVNILLRFIKVIELEVELVFVIIDGTIIVMFYLKIRCLYLNIFIFKINK